MALAIYFLLCLALSSSCEAYKALVVYGLPSSSHANLGAGLVRNMLKEGHEVTYITAVEYKNPPANLRQIVVSENFVILPPGSLSIEKIMNKDFEVHGNSRYWMLPVARSTLENKEVQKLFGDPNEHFDVVIVEWMYNDIMAGIANIYNSPLIWMSSSEVNSRVLSLIDAAPNPAYVIDIESTELPPLNFKQRVEELWNMIKLQYDNFMYFDKIEENDYNRLIAPHIAKRGRVPPSYNDVRYNASLIFGNAHVSMGLAYTIPENFKPIGGYHIDEKVKPLPEDLKIIMESSKDGVMYFSMGSNLRSKDWPESIKQDLLKMFGELKQTVLWKFEEDLPNVPKNVHILKWAPQPSILSHPNCKLFITHGGHLSTTEAVHYGVPIIGVPVFADQFLNVERAVRKGYAVEVDLSYKLADELKVAIKEVLQNPKYSQKVKELSFIYHDRPVKPAAEMLHWIRHVVQLRGAPHLRSPAADVPLYQRLYLDLLALFSIVFLVLLFGVKKLCSLVWSYKQVGGSKKNN